MFLQKKPKSSQRWNTLSQCSKEAKKIMKIADKLGLRLNKDNKIVMDVIRDQLLQGNIWSCPIFKVTFAGFFMDIYKILSWKLCCLMWKVKIRNLFGLIKRLKQYTKFQMITQVVFYAIGILVCLKLKIIKAWRLVGELHSVTSRVIKVFISL